MMMMMPARLVLLSCMLLYVGQAYRMAMKLEAGSSYSTLKKPINALERRYFLSRVLGVGVASAGIIMSPLIANAETTKTKVVSQSKVRETANGVKYVDVAKGEGESPKDGDFVIINYIGYLKDGTVFDGEHAKGKKPLAFKIGAKQVIPGLEEALETMKAGGERQIYVPAELAFGEKGVCLPSKNECLVPPNSAVKYDVILKRVAVSPI